MGRFNWLFSYDDKLFSNDYKEYTLKRKQIFLKFLFIVAFIFFGTFLIINTINKHYNFLLIDIISIIVLFILLVYWLRYKKVILISRFVLIFIEIVILYFTISGGYNNSGIYYIFLYPPMLFFIEKKQYSILHILFFILLSVSGLYLLDLSWATFYPPEKAIRLLIILITLSITSFVYISVIEKLGKKFTESQQELIFERDKLHTIATQREQFISILSHDLKNSFNSLLGFSSILLRQHLNSGNEKQATMAKTVYNNSKRTYDLLENVLKWTQLNAGRLKYSPTQFNISGLIKENVLLMKDYAILKKIHIHSHFNQSVMVFGDSNMIATILRNLLSNAVKFTPDGGNIEVSYQYIEAGEKVIISITDTGVGVNEKELQHLFENDHIKETEGTNKEKGTSLGLVLCKEFIDLHREKIWAESNVNHGSTFSFTLKIN